MGNEQHLEIGHVKKRRLYALPTAQGSALPDQPQEEVK